MNSKLGREVKEKKKIISSKPVSFLEVQRQHLYLFLLSFIFLQTLQHASISKLLLSLLLFLLSSSLLLYLRNSRQLLFLFLSVINHRLCLQQQHQQQQRIGQRLRGQHHHHLPEQQQRVHNIECVHRLVDRLRTMERERERQGESNVVACKRSSPCALASTAGNAVVERRIAARTAAE